MKIASIVLHLILLSIISLFFGGLMQWGLYHSKQPIKDTVNTYYWIFMFLMVAVFTTSGFLATKFMLKRKWNDIIVLVLPLIINIIVSVVIYFISLLVGSRFADYLKGVS